MRASIEPALPPIGMAGVVDALALCSPVLQPFIQNPLLSIKPRSQWPPRLRKCRVRCRGSEWEKVLLGLYERKIIDFLPESSLVRHRSEPLLNGLFGVPKGEVGAPGYSPKDGPLRFIINAMPTNDLQ